MPFIALVPPIYLNVKSYGAAGDGVTDDTTAIAAASTAANAAGGGTVFFPAGTYISGNQTLYANVHLLGAGVSATIIQLKTGANTDLFSAQVASINLAAAYGSSIVGTVFRWSIENMTLDGNTAGQTAGPSYPIRVYSYNYILQNVHIRNGYSGGILSDWNGGSSSPNESMEAQLINVKVHGCGGIGIQWSGPHDSQWTHVIVWSCGSHDAHLAPNCGGMQLDTCHFWGTPAGVRAVPLILESSFCMFNNVVCEGGDLVQFVLLGGPNVISGCYFFGNTPFTTSGIQIGQQAGQPVYPGQLYQAAGVTTAVPVDSCKIDCACYQCQGANGSIWFANDNGNMVDVQAEFASGSLFGGSIDGGTMFRGRVNGIAPDGTAGKGGWLRLPISSTTAFQITNRAGSDIFTVDTTNKHIQIPNATDLIQYSDAYSTIMLQLFGGTLAFALSLSANAIATGGTIATSGVGVARVTPAAAVTGVILQAGTRPGQVVVVLNKSAAANSITFAVAATSNVGAGVSVVIAGLQKQIFVWDSNDSRWY